MIENKYKWNSPLEWLEDKVEQWDAAQIKSELLTLARRLTSDDLQDEYENNMSDDGYFQKQHRHSVGVQVWENPKPEFFGLKDDCPYCEEDD